MPDKTIKLTVTEEITYDVYVALPEALHAAIVEKVAAFGDTDEFMSEDFDEWLGSQCADATINAIAAEYIAKRAESPHAFNGVEERDVTEVDWAPCEAMMSDPIVGVPLPIDAAKLQSYLEELGWFDNNEEDEETDTPCSSS